jgi:hypothetical protein
VSPIAAALASQSSPSRRSPDISIYESGDRDDRAELIPTASLTCAAPAGNCRGQLKRRPVHRGNPPAECKRPS